MTDPTALPAADFLTAGSPDRLLERLPDAQPVLRMVPMRSDANFHGDVFGGWIMAQVDIAGSLPAVSRANGRVATVAVTSFVFKQPVFVGDLVSFYAKVIKTGRTSVTVAVEVYAERIRLDSEVVKVTEATLVYVATDESREPRALPPLKGEAATTTDPAAAPVVAGIASESASGSGSGTPSASDEPRVPPLDTLAD